MKIREKLLKISIIFLEISAVVSCLGTVIFVAAMVILPAEPGMAGSASKWGIAAATFVLGLIFSVVLYAFTESLRILIEIKEKLNKT
ncbi:MAG: hypothetical protein PHE84_07550 [bacterium]|nr:hypothetical protein [bacterium]